MSSLHALCLSYESSSESSNEDNDCADLQKSSLKTAPIKLPLPQAFISTIKDPFAISNDQSQHQGRTRSFVHERGNWATHVCLPYSFEHVSEFRSCMDMAVCANKDLEHGIKFNIVEDFHLSISKTVAIPHHFIEPFVESLREKFLSSQTFKIHLSSSQLQYYVNDDRTRSFLGFQISSVETVSRIKRFMESVDGTMLDFRCATYYQDPSFHISVAWCLGDVTKHVQSDMFLEKIKENISTLECEFEDLFLFCVSEIIIKIGNKTFSFPLSE